LKPFEARFAVEERLYDVGIRTSDVPIRVGLFGVLKAGKIMTEQKSGTKFLSRSRLTATCCAEKIGPPTPDKTIKVRLFKD